MVWSIIHSLLLVLALACIKTDAVSSTGVNTPALAPPDTRIAFTVDLGSGITYSVQTIQATSNSTRVTVTSNKNSWVGISIGSQMVGSVGIIGLDPTDSANSALGLKSVNLYNLVSQTGVTSTDVVPLTTSLESNGVTDVSFTVLAQSCVLNFTMSQSSAQFPLLGTAPGSIIQVAFVTGSSQTLQIHQSFTFKSVAFSSTAAGGGRLPNAPLATRAVDIPLAIHISLQITAWLFIIPTGAMIAITRARKGPYAVESNRRWFKYHSTLQFLGVILSFAAWIAGIIHVQFLAQTPHFSKSHHVFGYIIGVFMLTQLANALLMRPEGPTEDGQVPTKRRRRWSFMHRILVTILLINGLSNTLVGAATVKEVFGVNTLLVFPTGSTILVTSLATLVEVLAGTHFVVISLAFVIVYRRHRKDHVEPTKGDEESYPEKPAMAAALLKDIQTKPAALLQELNTNQPSPQKKNKAMSMLGEDNGSFKPPGARNAPAPSMAAKPPPTPNMISSFTPAPFTPSPYMPHADQIYTNDSTPHPGYVPPPPIRNLPTGSLAPPSRFMQNDTGFGSKNETQSTRPPSRFVQNNNGNETQSAQPPSRFVQNDNGYGSANETQPPPAAVGRAGKIRPPIPSLAFAPDEDEMPPGPAPPVGFYSVRQPKSPVGFTSRPTTMMPSKATDPIPPPMSPKVPQVNKPPPPPRTMSPAPPVSSRSFLSSFEEEATKRISHISSFHPSKFMGTRTMGNGGARQTQQFPTPVNEEEDGEHRSQRSSFMAARQLLMGKQVSVVTAMRQKLQARQPTQSMFDQDE